VQKGSAKTVYGNVVPTRPHHNPGHVTRTICSRDDHYPVYRLDIRQDSQCSTGLCVDWILGFLDPDSGCVRQDPDSGFLDKNRIRAGFGYFVIC